MFKLTAVQQVPCTIAYTDAKGNPAAVEGAPVWTTSNAAVITVDAAPDGLSAIVKAAGTLGQAQLSITADARFGPEVVPVITLAMFEVVAAEAVAGTVTRGDPVDQPTARSAPRSAGAATRQA
jgi:hypothetical protein